MAETAPGSPTPAPPPARRGGRFLSTILITTLVGAAGAGYAYHQVQGRYFQETDDAYVHADAIVISSKVAGYVAEVLVEDNAEVQAGQPLLRIDPRDYRAQVAQSQAQVAVAKANAENIRASMAEQIAAIERAQAQLDAAEARAIFDRSQIVRYEPLAKSGAEPAERLAQLRQTASASAADVTAQRAALSMAQRRSATLKTQLQQAMAQADAAQAQLDAAAVNLEATLIRAPAAGRVGDKTVMLGQLAQPGTRLLSIVPADKVDIEANFKETQIGLMRPGQPVKITVDALSGQELSGRVASIAPGTGAQFSLLPPQNATGNFTKIVQRVPVRIILEAGPETRQLLIPGLSVTATVDTRGAKDVPARIDREQRSAVRQGT
ncbi:HlyD family secretion protein [Nitrospirillum iridis]|uniref:Membrane fusion protein (Multidrug efflux system) n=1 Tax=Nitrospirillum iridis TaxID=765888 RepID=A0A7X0EFU7_9PROT|nr:HlyD family secretion protein [Nitrospirillum iridis]MBB6255373.1 membrane fusion protein (multidrug efflux system) [Nitrospirillum iridis]